MGKWQRHLYQPVLPLGPGGSRLTGSAAHIELSRKAATEGMVLLKNENHLLPLASGSRVALFGKASIDYVKGGGGSGDVTVSYTRNLYEGMLIKEQEGKIRLDHALGEFYGKNVQMQRADGAISGFTIEPEVPEELMNRAAEMNDIAIISICRFSGEGWDRKTVLDDSARKNLRPNLIQQLELSARIFQDGDYYLTKEEAALVEKVTSRFEKVAVVLNIGGICDTSWFDKNPAISSVLMGWQAGMEGGLAEADLLVGDAFCCGKLTDTFASSLEDYPSTADFHESLDYVNYTDDIYVGYRYFETIPGAAEKVNYPFGFGLSYTTFALTVTDESVSRDRIAFTLSVKNTGNYPGREVVQLYYSAPQGLLGKPARELGAFQKTPYLAPGESCSVTLTMNPEDMASFDDLGRIEKAAFVLEKGIYHFYLGTDVHSASLLENSLELAQDEVVSRCTSLGTPQKLEKRLRADGSWEKLPCVQKSGETGSGEKQAEENLSGKKQLAVNPSGSKVSGSASAAPVNGLVPQKDSEMDGIKPAERGYARYHRNLDFFPQVPQLIQVAEGQMSLDNWMSALPVSDKIQLLGGIPNQGICNTFGFGGLPEYGVPGIMTADGPAGLRVLPEVGVCTTAWPCGTLLACTWDPELVEEVGKAGALELKENNLGVWLTPAMNIHRSPLCGRNFEYYSEDPLVTGKTGAAMIRGIQSEHIGACMKHFCCNNKESNRKDSDSRLSERTLREIYLRGFEIAAKEAEPYMVMTSYNIVNGCRASEQKDLLTGILREEWGYKGCVTTDWWTHSEEYLEIKAGNDLKMGTGFPERVMEAMEKGLITEEEITASAKRVVEVILKME